MSLDCRISEKDGTVKTEISSNRSKSAEIDSEVASNIYEAIRRITHGSVRIHIQDGKIVQIDRLEKVRMR